MLAVLDNYELKSPHLNEWRKRCSYNVFKNERGFDFFFIN